MGSFGSWGLRSAAKPFESAGSLGGESRAEAYLSELLGCVVISPLGAVHRRIATFIKTYINCINSKYLLRAKQPKRGVCR